MKKILALLSISTLFLLTGCWNYREIDTISIVSGVAVDKNEDGSYHLTAEIIEITGTPSESKLTPKRVESDGYTLLDAIRTMIKLTGKRLYWTHAKAIIISKDVAQDGILPILDFFIRNDELRISIDTLVSKEKTAKEILSVEGTTEKIICFEIEKMLEEHTSEISIIKKELYKFGNDYTSDGVSGTIPAIEIVENDQKQAVKLSGIAIFNEDKLIGFIGSKDTYSLLFIEDDVEQGVYPVKVVNDKNEIEYITLEILKTKTKVTPIYIDGKLKVDIKIKTKVSIAELGNYKSDLDEQALTDLEMTTEKQLEQDIEETINFIQTEYGVDIFGFGTMVKANLPNLWKKIGKDWEVYYKDLDVKVDSKIEIISTGYLNKSIKKGE